jgi:hypothetical protein
MNNNEIFELLNIEFLDNDFFRYSCMLSVLQKVYFNKFNKKIGRNNTVKLLNKLIDRNIIIVSGDYGFSEYRLKK